MATVTKGRTFVSGEVVTPTKLNTLVDSATVTQIVDADVSATAGIVDTKLATIATAGKVANTATTATSANTANAIVARDASGNFSAGTITATAFAGTGATLLVPTGAVMPFAMNSAPSGWLAADGSAVSRTTYSSLWTALGTTSSPYGQGDGSTTFNLPDLRASFVRGAGSDGVATSGTFGAKQADAFQGHRHTFGFNRGNNSAGSPGVLGTVATTTTVSDPTSDGTNGDPRTATETRPRNIAMLYCIKF
jgi:microcystin-dependent protein